MHDLCGTAVQRSNQLRYQAKWKLVDCKFSNFESVSTVVTIWYCLFVVVILSCNYVSVVVCNIVTVR